MKFFSLMIFLLSFQALAAAGFAAEPEVRPLTVEEMIAQSALQSLPYPILIPKAPAFKLLDVRLNQIPHARLQSQLSYTLIFLSGEKSFMLQSRLPTQQQPASACDKLVLAQSQSVYLQGYAFEPQVIEILSPACSAAGQALSSESISQEQAQALIQSLDWYYPLTYQER